MNDQACAEFLQWALPELHLRWEGFRKVRGQVCKRISRRLQTLKLRDFAAYRDHLQRNRQEWEVVDALCRVTISRFYRDRRVFSTLQSAIFPELLRQMRGRGDTQLRVWCAGCAAGEEPYSLSILWELGLGQRAAGTYGEINIIATDSDPLLLARAAAACYPYSAIKNLPADWRRCAFVEISGEFCLRPPFRRWVDFFCQDIRLDTPPGLYDLVLCRNLAFTYFDDALQRQTLRRLAGVLQPNGILIIGIHESLPQDYDGLSAWSQRLGIYQCKS